MLFKIALRNISRHRRRTFFSAITIAAGMFFFIAIDSIMSGLDRGAIDNMVALTTAALRLETPEYAAERDAVPLRAGVPMYQQLRDSILHDKRVKGVTGRTKFIGQLSIYTDMKPVAGTVIDPATDSTVFTLREYVKGSYFSQESDREIIIGKKLAEELGLGIGSWVTLYALTRNEAHNADEFKIVGLLATTDPVLNGSGVFISYRAADSFLDLDRLITSVMVGVHRRVNFEDFNRDVKAVKAALTARHPDLTMQTFLEQEAGFFEIAKSKRAFGFVFLFVILLIAAVGIFNTVLMSVYERIREIGVLRAFGFRRHELTELFLLEGCITGIIGVILGLAIGTIINSYLVTFGYPIDKVAGDAMGNYPIWGTVYGQWNFAMWIGISIFSVGISTAAALFPALKAGKMEIVTTLRFV
jgi:putative ABC transport system permease protein